MLWLQEVAASVAAAANASADRWSAEQVRDLVVGIIGALAAAFIAWQNSHLKKQNDIILDQNLAHEVRAQERSGTLPSPSQPPFPGVDR